MTRWPLVLSLLGGCSFALSGPDPKAPRNVAPTCDTSKSLVIVDGVMASVAGITALSVATTNGAAAIAPAAIGALFVGAAIHGNNVVNACNRAYSDYAAAISPAYHAPVATAEEQDDEEPKKLRPPPMTPHPVVAPPAPELAPADPYTPPPQPMPQPPPQQQPATPEPAPKPQPQPPPKHQPPPEAWGDFWKEVR